MVKYKRIKANKEYKCKRKVCNSRGYTKTTGIFLSFIILTLFSIQSFGQLAALQKVPATAAAGSSFTVKLSINRGPINGFMKLSQALPEGYTAVEMDSKSGDFRYENNETKIIWLKAPTEVTYTVTYKVNVPQNATGTISLGGKIIFVTNSNERKVFDLPVKKVTVTSGKVKSETDKSETAKNKVANTTDTKSKESVNEKDTRPTTANTSNKTSITPPPQMAMSAAKPKKHGYRKGGLEPDTSDEFENNSDYTGKNFKVQIGAFRQNHKMKNIPEHSTIIVGDITKHFSGNFSTYEEAAERKKLMVEQGFKDAFIASFPTGSNNTKTHVCKNWWHCLLVKMGKN